MNWVKTSERAPEAGGEFLVHYLATHFTGIAGFVAGPALPGQRWYAADSPGAGYAVPDYWAEIPPLPKEKSLGERVVEKVRELMAPYGGRPHDREWRAAMSGASAAATSKNGEVLGIRIVIDDTLADGVVELLRA